MTEIRVAQTLLEPKYQQLKNTPIGQWFIVFCQQGFYYHIRGKDCLIAIEHEPTNINRGPIHAKLDVLTQAINLEPSDGWDYGRYYFDLNRAVEEIEAWLRAWNQI